jgi:hypothetical protein
MTRVRGFFYEDITMDKQDLDKYQKQLCQILVEKRCKNQNMYKWVFGTVETVNNRCLYVVDAKGSRLKIPVESIREIHANEEQW